MTPVSDGFKYNIFILFKTSHLRCTLKKHLNLVSIILFLTPTLNLDQGFEILIVTCQ